MKPKKAIPIRVECHSGYKADEYPKCFYWKEIRFDILEILDRWYQYDPDSEWPIANYFKIRASNGKNYLLKHEMKSDQWYLQIPDQNGHPFRFKADSHSGGKRTPVPI